MAIPAEESGVHSNTLLAGKSILVLPRYSRNAPSSRLRTFQYVPQLQQAGAEVTIAPLIDDRYLQSYWTGKGKRPGYLIGAYLRRLLSLVKGKKFDLVWIEKEMFPYLPGIFESLVQRHGAPWVVDYDDAVFHRYDRRPLLAHKLDPLIQGAACITSGNAYIEQWARSLGGARIERIPTVLDPDRYPVKPAADDGVVRVGWIGTPANSAYLAPVIEALNDICRIRRVQLVTIGAPPLDGLTVPQERHDWSEESEAELLSTIDIGVMPLPDAPWERGKCGYKLLQYMAAGKPVVASPVGMNTEIVTSEVGYLASEPGEWRDALLDLIDDHATRQLMGAAGRRSVEEHFSVAVTGPRIVKLFAELCDGKQGTVRHPQGLMGGDV